MEKVLEIGQDLLALAVMIVGIGIGTALAQDIWNRISPKK